MKNSVEHPRRKSREAVMMALYALEIHNNVNEKSETGPLPSASILDDILSRKSFDDDQKKYIESLAKHSHLTETTKAYIHNDM